MLLLHLALCDLSSISSNCNMATIPTFLTVLLSLVSLSLLFFTCPFYHWLSWPQLFDWPDWLNFGIEGSCQIYEPFQFHNESWYLSSMDAFLWDITSMVDIPKHLNLGLSLPASMIRLCQSCHPLSIIQNFIKGLRSS